VRTTSDLCGRVLDARYRIDRVVATGGMGTVYEGFDSRLERVVAIKVMNDNLVHEPGFAERFVTEARAAARLSDQHVVAVYDRGRSADAVYLVMEYVPGRTLRQELTWGGRVPVARALDVLSGVLEGLRAAHAAGFVHGDVKPENVLITDRGQVKVTDFGLARAIEAGDHKATMLLGTAAYLAPEQFSDRVPDPRSDLYSSGILLFEMLTGHVPFRADSADDVLALHQTQRVPDPSAFVEVDTALDELCARATAKRPKDRFASADEMLAAVTALRRQADPAAGAPRQIAAPVPVAVTPTAAMPDTLLADSPFVIDATSAVAPPPPVADPQPVAASSGPAVAVIDPPEVSASPPAGTSAPPRRRRRRGPLVALVAAVGYVGWQLGTTDTISTPKLAGLTRAEALAKLESLGLTMRVSAEEYSERREAGTVISSDPAGGQRVAANGTVAVVLSKGPERYKVPNVKGMSQQDATRELADANLETGQILQDYSRKWPAGQVMRADPGVGTPLKRGTVVSLTISLGPEPVVVPDVANLTLDQARASLSGAGFRVKTSEQYDDTVPLGRVISTQPGSGTTAYRGDRIRVLVSKGSQFVPVPSVVGMDTESARVTLENAGFLVETREQFGVTLANRVLSQDPGGGTEAVRGTTVTLTIT
jgi:serine/threonine-protein kinase